MDYSESGPLFCDALRSTELIRRLKRTAGAARLSDDEGRGLRLTAIEDSGMLGQLIRWIFRRLSRNSAGSSTVLQHTRQLRNAAAGILEPSPQFHDAVLCSLASLQTLLNESIG